jgi:plasmid maintenance system antidote protein VapI
MPLIDLAEHQMNTVTGNDTSAMAQTDDTAAPQQPAAAEYNPENLLDRLSQLLRVKNDAALARTLEVATPVINRIRRGHTPVRASILMRMQEASGMSLQELRKLLGDKRKKFRMVEGPQ